MHMELFWSFLYVTSHRTKNDTFACVPVGLDIDGLVRFCQQCCSQHHVEVEMDSHPIFPMVSCLSKTCAISNSYIPPWGVVVLHIGVWRSNTNVQDHTPGRDITII